jgi:hypothetical protein
MVSFPGRQAFSGYWLGLPGSPRHSGGSETEVSTDLKSAIRIQGALDSHQRRKR